MDETAAAARLPRARARAREDALAFPRKRLVQLRVGPPGVWAGHA
jgi:hypothetical protein